MQLTSLLEKLVKDKELYDISDVSRAVFDNGIKCLVSAALNETLFFFDKECRGATNTPFEEMLLEIKKAFGSDWLKAHLGRNITDVREFFANGKSSCFALEILAIPEFIVVIFPLAELTTLLIMELEEAPEDFGIRI